MHRFGKAVQQQHQRRALLAGGEGVEGEGGCDGDFFELGHGDDQPVWSIPKRFRPIEGWNHLSQSSRAIRLS
jgi:hypothetical protein